MAIKGTERAARLGGPQGAAAGLRRNTADPQEYWQGPGKRKAFLELLVQNFAPVYKGTREANHR